MTDRCTSGKKLFLTQVSAEDVLIDLWTKNDYPPGQGAIAVYKCDDCGYYHLTSRPPMNARLSEFLSSPKLKQLRQASRWSDRLNRK